MKLFLLAICTALLFSQCSEKGLQTLSDVLNTTNEVLGDEGTSSLTNQDVISGLKEALKVGTDSAVGLASKTDGFYKNPLLFIEFPPEAMKVKNTLTDAGFGSLVEDFEMTLNRSAEEAAKYAAPIFIDAITDMTIQDGFNILNGPDNAATNYLKEKTTNSLRAEFKPVVDEAIKKVNLTKYWQPVISKYNLLTMLTGGEQVNPDLEAYVTTNAMDGLFKHIEMEEKQIREDPKARVSAILQKVFGSLGQN